MATHVISAEEKALLDAAKRVCRLVGFNKGKFITLKGRENEADEAMAEMIQRGYVITDSQYVKDGAI